MSAPFTPIGDALPPRRATPASIASAAPASASASDWGDSINVPLARDRMFEYFERDQLPGEVKNTLAASLNGDLRLQSLLFDAMLDTWPKLQKNISEVARTVSTAPWKIQPFAHRGESPTPAAEKLAKEVDAMVWGMRPRATRRELGFEGTVKALVFGYYYGHSVAEIRWQSSGGGWSPRCTKAVPPRYYGYPYDLGTTGDPEDRLMLDLAGGTGARDYADFPDHRFLVAIHGGHSGHPANAAPLRALAGYWLAAVYGLKWFLNFTQLYGIPWRHAEVGDAKDEPAVKAALAGIGTNGYIVTRTGTKINVLESAKSGDALPQKALIDLADDQCDLFILGQLLTSGTDGSGSRALGQVHAETLRSMIDGVADFVGEVLTRQLIPAIVALNWGEDQADLPELWAKREKISDEKALADRDEKLGIISGALKVGEAWFYERHNIPMPVEGDKLLLDAPELPATDLKPPLAKPQPVQAADASGVSMSGVAKLSSTVLEGLTGVTQEWLAPVRPVFERLAALAMSKHVTDDDFLSALAKSQHEMPELFDRLDTSALQSAFADAIGTAMLNGSVS